MKYIYGMRNRPAGPGCQPDGFLEFKDDPSGRYHDILFYDHRLPMEAAYFYELDYLGELTEEGAEKPTQAQDEAPVVNVMVEASLSDEEKDRLYAAYDSKFTLEFEAFGCRPGVEPHVLDDKVFLMRVPANMQEPARDYLEALIRFVKQATRINHRQPAAGTSKKYAFRVWLNRIGLKGPQYKATRKALLANLEGSAAYAGKEDTNAQNTSR